MLFLTMLHLVFIMYAKQEDDMQGEKVHSLSDLLRNFGIDCTIDLYHANDIEISNWSEWVTNQIKEHITSVDGNVLFVCSEAMIRLLDETPGPNNTQINMVYGRIDRLTLTNILRGNYTSKFLPMLIDEDQKNLVPHCLQEGKIYRFNYKALNNVNDYRTILDRSEFSSLRSLVATVSRQQQYPQPKTNSSKAAHVLCQVHCRSIDFDA